MNDTLVAHALVRAVSALLPAPASVARRSAIYFSPWLTPSIDTTTHFSPFGAA
jgi:hypothetical protein